MARTLLGFEFGCFGPLQRRWERIACGLPRPFRILYASDLHLGHSWTRDVPRQLAAAAQEVQPEVILLGGDLVDHARALPLLQACVRSLVATAPVHAIPGNHDRCLPSAVLQQSIHRAGGSWLPAHACDGLVRIEGSVSHSKDEVPRILCAHEPSIFPTALAAGYRLVLAGHLHGGQCVFATYRDRLYPAYWFQRWHVLRFQEADTLMLVSRGVADTLPLRFRCPREVLVCDLG